jgi:purine-binding chemotaxis protein CheW
MVATALSTANGARELMAFRVGAQEFCIDIQSVREIRGWSAATALPKTPGYVLGVINLRGSILPIIDLSARFGLGPTTPTGRHVIMVVQIGSRSVGLLVDAVSEIVVLNADLIQPPPALDSEDMVALIIGIVAHQDRLLCVLALEQVAPELETLAA